MANEKSGGHGERPGAVALIEAAAWDLRAKAQGVPLWRCIADYYGRKGDATIKVYASCGHFRTDDVLTDEVRRAVDAGYRCVKIKVAGDVDADLKRLERAAAALPSGTQWAVDANGAGGERSLVRRDVAFQARLDRGAGAAAGFRAPQGARGSWASRLRPARTFFRSTTRATSCATAGCARSAISSRSIRCSPMASTSTRASSSCWPRRQFLPHAGHLFAAHCVAAFGLGMAEAAPDAALIYGGYWDGVRVEAGAVKIPDLPGGRIRSQGQSFRRTGEHYDCQAAPHRHLGARSSSPQPSSTRRPSAWRK